MDYLFCIHLVNFVLDYAFVSIKFSTNQLNKFENCELFSFELLAKTEINNKILNDAYSVVNIVLAVYYYQK